MGKGPPFVDGATPGLVALGLICMLPATGLPCTPGTKMDRYLVEKSKSRSGEVCALWRKEELKT